jgi:hypothetical protein
VALALDSAAAQNIFVDPSIAADSGAGTVGDPYGDLEYAIASESHDTTNGTIFWIKAGTAEVLTQALDFSTFGYGSSGAPLTIAGYTSAAGDGGIGAIDADTFQLLADASAVFTQFVNMDLYGSVVASALLDVGDDVSFVNCHVYRLGNPSAADILISDSNAVVINSRITDGRVDLGFAAAVRDSVFLARDQITEYPAFILRVGASSTVERTIILANGTGWSATGLKLGRRSIAKHVSVYAADGQTGEGIDNQGNYAVAIVNCMVQGFNGTGGEGFQSRTGDGWHVFCGNVAYDCTDNYPDATDNLVNAEHIAHEDNEDAATGIFADPDAEDLLPVDTGNIAHGAWPPAGIGRGW